MMTAPASRAAVLATDSSFSYDSTAAKINTPRGPAPRSGACRCNTTARRGTSTQGAGAWYRRMRMTDGDIARERRTSRLLGALLLAFLVYQLPFILHGYDVNDEGVYWVATGRWL